MADTRTNPKPRPVAAEAQPQAVASRGRPEAEAMAALIAEAERIMGVKPLTDGPSRMLPGY